MQSSCCRRARVPPLIPRLISFYVSTKDKDRFFILNIIRTVPLASACPAHQALVQGFRTCVWSPLPEGWVQTIDPKTGQVGGRTCPHCMLWDPSATCVEWLVVPPGGGVLVFLVLCRERVAWKLLAGLHKSKLSLGPQVRNLP